MTLRDDGSIQMDPNKGVAHLFTFVLVPDFDQSPEDLYNEIVETDPDFFGVNTTFDKDYHDDQTHDIFRYSRVLIPSRCSLPSGF